MKQDSILGVRYKLVTLLWTWGILFIPAAMGLSIWGRCVNAAFLLSAATWCLLTYETAQDASAPRSAQNVR